MERLGRGPIRSISRDRSRRRAYLFDPDAYDCVVRTHSVRRIRVNSEDPSRPPREANLSPSSVVTPLPKLPWFQSDSEAHVAHVRRSFREQSWSPFLDQTPSRFCRAVSQ